MTEEYLKLLRDEFAMAALPAVIRQTKNPEGARYEWLAEAWAYSAYLIADAMIAARNKDKPE